MVVRHEGLIYAFRPCADRGVRLTQGSLRRELSPWRLRENAWIIKFEKTPLLRSLLPSFSCENATFLSEEGFFVALRPRGRSMSAPTALIHVFRLCADRGVRSTRGSLRRELSPWRLRENACITKFDKTPLLRSLLPSFSCENATFLSEEG